MIVHKKDPVLTVKRWSLLPFLFLWGMVYLVLYGVYGRYPSMSSGDDLNSIGAAQGFIENISYFYTHANGRLGFHILRGAISTIVQWLGITPFTFPWFGLSLVSLCLITLSAIIFSISHSRASAWGASRAWILCLLLFLVVLNQEVVGMVFGVSFAIGIYTLPLFLLFMHIHVLRTARNNFVFGIWISWLAYFFAIISSEQILAAGTIISFGVQWH